MSHPSIPVLYNFLKNARPTLRSNILLYLKVKNEINLFYPASKCLELNDTEVKHFFVSNDLR